MAAFLLEYEKEENENLCSQVEKRFTLFIIWVLKKK
jgi:hypothetical protein